MNISKYQKLFGVGLLGFGSSLILLGGLWLLNKALNHVEIFSHPWPLRLIGLIFITVWIFWHIWCLKTIRSWWKNNQLCTSGPYRFVRHPIYSGGIFGACSGTALIFNSWILLLWPLLSYLIWSLLVRKEEKIMQTVFGEEYRRYAERTGKLFPKFFK